MEIPRGRGVARAKVFKEKYGAKLESNEKTFRGEGKDYFLFLL